MAFYLVVYCIFWVSRYDEYAPSFCFVVASLLRYCISILVYTHLYAVHHIDEIYDISAPIFMSHAPLKTAKQILPDSAALRRSARHGHAD